MKKNIILIAAVILSVLAVSCKQEMMETTAPHTYNITLKEYPNQPAPGLQSFSFGTYNDYWLVLAGRINGFHGTANTNPNRTFPAKFANKYIWVIHRDSTHTWKVKVPSQYSEQLSAANTGHYQDGNMLFIAGGYGEDNNGNHLTYGKLTVISVKEMVTSIVSGDTSNVADYITSIDVDEMKVTGGELLKLNNNFYLAVGQDFEGVYDASKTGNYTNEVRKFNITFNNSNLTADFLGAYSDGKSAETTQFHRRDLNVMPVIRADKTPGITIFGGVFTQVYNGGFVYPIHVYETSTGTVAEVDSSFEQRMCQYSSANISIYDGTSNTMYSTMLGGISLYAYENGVLKADPNLPFIKSVYTIIRNADGSYNDYVQPENMSLPGYLGAEAQFIPSGDLLMSGNDVIIDASKIPATGGLIGYFYGGILSQKAQSSQLFPTVANNKIYEVHLSWN